MQQSSEIDQFAVILCQVAPKQAQDQQTPLRTQAPNSALRPVIETTDVAAHGSLQLKLGHENELQLKIVHVADE